MRWAGLSAADVRTVEALFDQQMWCWGCDVRRGEGNLLLEYGGKRLPPAEPRLRSGYRFAVDPAYALTLWGWGLWVAAEGLGSLFMRRARFEIVWCASAHLAPRAWCERDLAGLLVISKLPDKRARRLLHTAFTWIADYESWIADRFGCSYRALTLAAYPQRGRCKNLLTADRIALAWRELGEKIRLSVFNQLEK
ncbi:MAG: hypothetical protein CUN53_15705 [Phototrophicales bacterium]|nr:MAG: hypothetical protein CUN53_15705 [Phototrophicales bacterium]